MSVPEIPGAHSQGRTLEEARETIKDAVRLLLEVRREDAEREVMGRRGARTPDRLKRRQLLRHPFRHGCELGREDSDHSIYRNTATDETTAVPRHTEIANNLARKICKDLGISPP